MKTSAAVLVELGRPLEQAELELAPLKPGQVLVEVRYSGVCHTQLLEAEGWRGQDSYLPHCLGHEGSGVVLEAGPGVSKVKPSESVILSWVKGQGRDAPGSVHLWGSRKVNAGPIATFMRHAIISENRLTPLGAEISLREAALLGCAIPTGFGAVFNAARPQPGQSLVVFGAGGVGLCAVAAARILGCAPIVAVDIVPAKLELAKKMGADQTVDAAKEPVLEALRKIFPKGADFAVEATGRPEAMQNALAAVRPQGGAAVVVGNARHGETLSLDPRELNLGKRLLGTWGGDNFPDRDYPRYARLWAGGRADLSPLLGRAYSLEEVGLAFQDLRQGRAARPLIEMRASA